MEKKKFDRRLAELGGKVNITGARYWTLCIEAPAGYIWAGSGLHETIYEQDEWTKRAEIYKTAIEDMQMGVVKCEEVDCDWCNSQEVSK